MNSTLEGTDDRITQAEEQIRTWIRTLKTAWQKSLLQKRIQEKKKNEKKMKVQETYGTTLNTSAFTS